MRRVLGVLTLCLFLAAVSVYAEQETVTYAYDDAGRLISADYGDGRSITYTYDNAGNLLQRVVQAPLACSLTCEATVTPIDGLSPLDVVCQALGTPANCTGDVTYAWDMGDGTTFIVQNPTHTYGPGTHTWTATVSIEDQTCTVTGTVTVGQIPGDCDGLGTVTIGEVQKGINMFLGVEPVSCGVDCDASGTATIGEVQKVINNFLGNQSLC
jgi:YD repeat-containing protein